MIWEYKIVHINASKWTGTGLPADLGERFDQWGSEGWELVRIEPILRGGFVLLGFGTTGTSTDSLVAFFERPKE